MLLLLMQQLIVALAALVLPDAALIAVVALVLTVVAVAAVAVVGLESAPRRRRLGHRPLARDKRFPCGTEIRSN